MDDFDKLINFEEDAINQGKQEAISFYIEKRLPEKGRETGFNLGNELGYYETILDFVVSEEEKIKSS